MNTEQYQKSEQLRAALQELGCVVFMWHKDDVKNEFDVTDEQAIEILKEVEHNERVIETIFDVIYDLCEQYEYERIDE